MNRRYIPSPPLDAYIACFWYFEGASQPHARERLLPNGEASIVFNLRDEDMSLYQPGGPDIPDRPIACSRVLFSGPRTGCFAIDSASEDRVIGIQFRPGGTWPFFTMPAAELANQSLALDCLWHHTAITTEQLLAAPTLDTMFRVLEATLMAQLARPLDLHPAVRLARRRICLAPQCATVSALTEASGLSHRRFSQLFQDQVGLSPKAFCRVRRFQRVLQSVHRRRSVDWAQVALDGGYFDQAHLIHDFQSFSGLTPSAYLARATEHLNHVPIL